MSELSDLRDRLAGARDQRDAAAARLLATRARLAQEEARLAQARRAGKVVGKDGDVRGLDGSARELVARHRDLVDETDRLADAWRSARGSLRDLDLVWERFSPPTQLIEELDDRTPILLLPVRVEARFFGSELRVRFYPDDVAIQTHEAALTAAERTAGQSYWEREWRAGGDPEARRAAWRALVADREPNRAAWIAHALTPTNEADAPQAPVPLDAELLPAPVFPDVPGKEDDWTAPASVRVLPDRFVATLHGPSETRRVIGRPVPDTLAVGPDPLQLDQELQHQADGNLAMGSGMDWMVDFEAAEAIGMAVRFEELPEPEIEAGFDRLTVLGIRFGSDGTDVVGRLEALFENHRFGAGFSFLPQGTPTNNTTGASAGFDRAQDAGDGLFDVERSGPLFTAASDDHEMVDGQRFAEALGLDPAVFHNVRHADGRDLGLAEAVNTALFRGTLGYYMEEMLAPAMSLEEIRSVREFFVRHVRARGALPAFRVARQPYGVLLTTAYSRLQLDKEEEAALGPMKRLLDILDTVWDRQDIIQVGGGDDGEADILHVLGLHAASVDYHARHLVGWDYLQNLLALGGATDDYVTRWSSLYMEFVGELLAAVGHTVEGPDDIPRILQLSFMRRQSYLNGPSVDSNPLSEQNPLPPVTADGDNYIRWLLRASLDDVRRQRLGLDGDGQPLAAPRALLYLLLRHALLLEYWDSAMRLHERFEDVAVVARREVELLNMEDSPNVTRWDYLEAPVFEVSGNEPVRAVLERPFRPSVSLTEVAELHETKDALAELAPVPTAALERLLAEHVDLCSYRLDAWKQGILHRRLKGMRVTPAGEGVDARIARPGVPPIESMILGAYGWLENIRRRPAATPVDDGDLAVASVGGLAALPGSGGAVERLDNGGFIHAPSISHATTAAVLRSGYLTHREDEDSSVLAVNLSSARTREAMTLLEGVRAGWSLSALLGYRFERGLHDRSPTLELDQFIHVIRQHFPLTAGAVHDLDPGEDATAAEARQHLDGAALIEAFETTGYPYGVVGLPAVGTAEATAIRQEVDLIADALDALGDLGLAESVFQVVQGNFERAGAVLDAVSRGAVPPEPDLVRTPRGGIGQIHRVGVTFSATAPVANPWPAVAMTPRGRVESRVNAWLGGLLGHAERVRTNVVVDPGGTGEASHTVHLHRLGLQPLDLLAATSDDLAGATGVSELERRVAARARTALSVSDGVAVRIDWMDRSGFGEDITTFFELLPMLRGLRNALGSARAITARDFLVPSDDVPGAHDPHGIDFAELEPRVAEARLELSQTLGAVSAALAGLGSAALDPPVIPAPNAFAEARLALERAALHGLPDAFPHTAVDVDVPAALSLLAQLTATLGTLTEKLAAADALLVVPAEESPDQRRDRMLGACAAIYGRDLTIVPRFSVADTTELLAAAANSGTLLAGAPPLAVDEWLDSVGRVRPNLRAYGHARALADVFGSPPATLTVLQLPHREDDRWAALPLVDGKEPPGDTVSWVLERPPDFGAASAFAGLLLDEMTEVIPNTRGTTGVAFHFDQPNSEPPQALLLAISPNRTGRWTWDDLEAVLSDTLDEARKRAVEPDQIQDTVFDQFLPAITPAVSHLPATIGLNLVLNVAVVAATLAIEDT